MTGILHVVVARKPIEGTVAENFLFWHCGAINVDGCRIGNDDTRGKASLTALGVMNDDNWKARFVVAGSICGRFPANLILDKSEDIVSAFPITERVGHTPKTRGIGGLGTSGHSGQNGIVEKHHDTGSAARFFFNFAEQESDE